MTATRRYTAVLEDGGDGWITVYFPAVPGCVTQGRTREEALANAREALQLHTEGLREERQSLPDADGTAVEAVSIEVTLPQ